MSKEKLERNENEELKKTINPEPEVSDLQESENSLQEEDSTEEITKEEAEEATEENTEEIVEETAEEVHEDELMELPASSGRQWLVAIFIAVIIAVIIGVVIIIMCRPKEKEPEPIAAVEQVQEEPEVEEVVESEPVKEEAIAEEELEESPTQSDNEESKDSTETVDMVEFELWATQPESDVPCLVVWNEIKGKQEIIQPGEKYITEEGDILAVPYKEGMFPAYVNSTKQTIVDTDYGQYYSIVLEDTWNTLDFTFEEVTYKYVVKAY